MAITLVGGSVVHLDVTSDSDADFVVRLLELTPTAVPSLSRRVRSTPAGPAPARTASSWTSSRSACPPVSRLHLEVTGGDLPLLAHALAGTDRCWGARLCAGDHLVPR
ncbi:MAG TPA: hypothetical protein VGD29_29245 [Actinoplanes sp.]|jgi:hypothetical protein